MEIAQELIYTGVGEEEELWREMAFALESSSQTQVKVTVENSQDNDLKQKEECEHSFIYRDDTGEVCCVCGLIKRHIATMIEFVFNKVTLVENSQENDFKQIDDCDHSFIYKDYIGEVCCVCGLIKTPVSSIIEVVYNKDKPEWLCDVNLSG